MVYVKNYFCLWSDDPEGMMHIKRTLDGEEANYTVPVLVHTETEARSILNRLCMTDDFDWDHNGEIPDYSVRECTVIVEEENE